MADVEGEHLEFKEWKTKADFDELTRYCCALANEGGGTLLLGVTDKRPRRIVSTTAIPQLEEARRALLRRLPLNIQVSEILHSVGRVVVFEVPSRPFGIPMMWDGLAWARKGDSLVPTPIETLHRIWSEAGQDFSADTCPDARPENLDPAAVEQFRARWIAKSGNAGLGKLSQGQLLRDAELIVDGLLTYVALILFGAREALGRLLARAEVVFEYRSSAASGSAQERHEYRQGFFTFHDQIWKDIAKRNDLQHYQDGLFVVDILTFDERAVRGAILNAVCHRNYQLGGNVFVRQFARKLVVERPGGFPYGITPENILDHQSPRNRRIAEVLAKCGLVERSGQGMNLMFERSISQGKMRPEFVGSDAYQVVLTLHGEVTDSRFVQYLEKLGRERQVQLGTQDFLLLDLIRQEQPVPEHLKPRLVELRELGAIESVGRGRGTRYLLSRGFYSAAGTRGVHTRRRGLDREQNKALLMTHLASAGADGCPISELQQVLPAVGRGAVQALVQELRAEGRVELLGSRRWARWRLSSRGAM